MKKHFFLFMMLLCCFGMNGKSQSYHPFPDTNAIWAAGGDNVFTNAIYRFRYGIFGDTLIGDYHYKKIYSLYDSTLMNPNSTYFAAIREDSNRRVYCFLSDYPSEFLLYDFNLVVGDTIWFPINGSLCSDNFAFMEQSHYKVVTAIDSMLLLNNEYRKRWQLQGPYMSDTWIEGVGCVNWYGLFNPVIGAITLCGDGYYFVCFKDNNTTLYLANPFCNQCFCTLLTSIDEKEQIDGISVFPNPMNDKINVSIPQSLLDNNPILSICNLRGQVIIQQVIQSSETELDLHSFSKGIYFLKIDYNQKSIVRKIIRN